LGVRRSAGRDGNRAKTRLVVGHEVAIAHDEAGADRADAVLLLPGELRVDVEIQIDHALSHGRPRGRAGARTLEGPVPATRGRIRLPAATILCGEDGVEGKPS